MTLYEKLTDWRLYQCRKHNLHEDEDEYLKEQINGMSQHDFLREISEALEEILESR